MGWVGVGVQHGRKAIFSSSLETKQAMLVPVSRGASCYVEGSRGQRNRGMRQQRVFDFLEGNDLILKSDLTEITAGNTINGGGSNAFAGERLYVGQKIRLEGLGRDIR